METYEIKDGDVFEIINNRGGKINRTFALRMEIESFYSLAGENVKVKIVDLTERDEWDEGCKDCIWLNDETGKCEGSRDIMGFYELSPFYKKHPELKGKFPLGGGADECLNMVHRPKRLVAKD